MELLILDKEFNNSNALDIFESLIWTDRYFECGDFELYMPADSEILKMLPQGYYLYLKESEHIMIVEDVEIETDTEEGAHLKITGRSLESLLDRRIIWGQKVLSGNLQEGIKTLLNENVISPSDENRKINNFIFRDSTDPNVTKLNLDAQYYGDNLYDVIVDICKSSGIGFKITLEDKTMVFSLYCGIDHSYTQIVHPYVIFSPGFDNLMNSNYIESIKTLKNVTLVAGEGEGPGRKTTTVYSDSTQPSGFDRRELFTDASGISQKTEDGDLTDEEYLSQLSQKGTEELSNNKETKSFEGELDISATYTYDEDYSLGDIVQAENEFGNEERCRITEFIRSQDENGTDFYPTFETTGQSVMSIPSDYTPVEYIESHGSEYIDTGFKPNQDTRVVCDIQVTAAPVGYDFFGSRTSDASADEYNFWYDKSKLYSSYGTSKGVAINIAPMPGRLKIDKDKNVTTVNGTTVTNTSGQTFSSPYSMFIYCNNTRGSPYRDTKCFAKLYSFQIYDNGTLVRNFVPVRSDAGEYGLYDTVNSQFYGNAGTGAFTGGGVVLPSGYQKVNYIKPDQEGCYIDTLVNPNSNTGIAMFYHEEDSGDLFGARSSKNSSDLFSGWSSYDYSVSQTTYRDCFGSMRDYSSSIIVANKDIFIFKNKNVTSINGTSFSNPAQEFSCPYPMFIFATDTGGDWTSNDDQNISKLYHFFIYDNYKTIREFIPCKNPNGEYGLYELIEGKFYGNAGTGAFTGG